MQMRIEVETLNDTYYIDNVIDIHHIDKGWIETNGDTITIDITTVQFRNNKYHREETKRTFTGVKSIKIAIEQFNHGDQKENK